MAEPTRSPLAPKSFPRLPVIAGLKMGSLAAGIKYKRRADLTLFELAKGSTIAGVFTQSTMPGAPVEWCRQHIKGGRVRGIVINAGNANVFTGAAGLTAVEDTAKSAAELIGAKAGEIFVASTGVIGETLAVDRLITKLPTLHRKLASKRWSNVAKAICTTDTFPKAATRTALIDGNDVQITGIAKGSGMIMPDMATMLAFLFTDAKIPAPVLQSLLKSACNQSFNAITVDGDTSTSDTVLLCATGQGPRHKTITNARDPRLKDFKAALQDLTRDLAQQVVRDGEGASKFIAVTVSGAENKKAAKRIALTVANSPLVKTAIAGEDANWGRIIMAVGRAAEKANRDKLAIRIGGISIAKNGYLDPDYREEQVIDHMRGQEIDIAIDVGIDRGKATVWTCDLTHGYISINADYRS
jgi:glutamate N-acetyltransferase/amino-acid N-acetyltransferase